MQCNVTGYNLNAGTSSISGITNWVQLLARAFAVDILLLDAGNFDVHERCRYSPVDVAPPGDVDTRALFLGSDWPGALQRQVPVGYPIGKHKLKNVILILSPSWMSFRGVKNL